LEHKKPKRFEPEPGFGGEEGDVGSDVPDDKVGRGTTVQLCEMITCSSHNSFRFAPDPTKISTISWFIL